MPSLSGGSDLSEESMMSDPSPSVPFPSFPSPSIPSPLVSVSTLQTLLERPESASALRIVDCRWYLSGPRHGRTEYAAGHLPGAVFADLDADLSQKDPLRAPIGGRHPLPPPALFVAAMKRLGISADTHVVVYDDAAGAIAARLWWMLRYYGHSAVSVLEGGVPAWVAAGGRLETTVPAIPPGTFDGTPNPDMMVDGAYMRAHVGQFSRRGHALEWEGDPCASVGAPPQVPQPSILLIDARSGERYRGEVEPIDSKAGHIPGAVNVPFTENLEGGVFKPAEVLRARYEQAGVGTTDETILYCGSGVTACHDLLALSVAGYDDVKLYPGSWSDWCNDQSLPIAVGNEER